MKELIHFAHGNGFPSMCYKQMLDRLATRFDYCYIDRIGHNPKYPVENNWHNLVLELVESIETQADKPVIGLGHSLGGVLNLLAAIERPDLFKTVVVLDSPFIGPVKSHMVKLAKALGIIDRVTPASRSKGRRKYWQNHDQVLNYLKSRDLFSTFTDACLEDYIQYGLEKKSDGYYLRFDRHIEYQIYRTIPDAFTQYHGKLMTPSALIYGDKTTVVDKMDVIYMKKYFHIKTYTTVGTHLFPMERPVEVADQILSVLDDLL